MTREQSLLRRIRVCLSVFMAGLVFSGVTALPLPWELRVLSSMMGTWAPAGLRHWLDFVRQGLDATGAQYPFMAYGTDWLAFGHFVIAIAFVGPYRDPVRNQWVIQFGLIACALVVPYALLFGLLRGIPFFWRLIDCSFGLLGLIPLWLCRRDTGELAQLQQN